MVGAGANTARGVRLLISVATAVSILGLAVLVLLTPFWTQTATRATSAQYFATPDQAVQFSDSTVGKLVFGGDFEEVGQGFYTADEASHLRDARTLLYGFVILVVVSAAFVSNQLFRRTNRGSWSAVANGGRWLIVGVVVLGVVGFLAFDVGFELFHRIFFPGGNWEFSADSNMIRLYPYAFWQWTGLALGLLASAGGLVAWRVGRSRERRLAS